MMIAEWLPPFPGYPRRWVRPDLIAGLTTAAVVIPKAMAFAAIAGLPVQVGLYTALVPMVVYALLGTSRPLSMSTTSTIAILVAAELRRAVPSGASAELLLAATTLAILVGVMLIVACVLRLGFVANFISESVLTGFKSGIGLVIIVDQLPKLLGIDIDKSGFFRDILAIAHHIPDASLATVALGGALLLLIFGLERVVPRAPAPLLAVAVAIAATVLLGLSEVGVATVGSISGGLPRVTWPQFDLVQGMWPAAAGIALMSFTETIAAARAFRDRGEPRPVPNRELLALGLANLAGGLFGAMPAGGGTTQTAVNRRAGARTQVAAGVTAGVTLATILLFAPVIGLMPHAALAAVVVAYSVDLLRPGEFADIHRVRRAEFYWALIAFAGVVLLGTLQGILVAIIVSFLTLAQQDCNPPVYPIGRARGSRFFRPLRGSSADDETWPGLLIVRVEGRLFFGNAQRVADKIRPLMDRARPKVVLLDLSAVIDLEYTALKMLIEAEEQGRRDGSMLWLAALNPGVIEVVKRSKLAEVLGPDCLFGDLETAVEHYRGHEAPASSP